MEAEADVKAGREVSMEDILPDPEAEKRFKQELLERVSDVSQYLPGIA